MGIAKCEFTVLIIFSLMISVEGSPLRTKTKVKSPRPAHREHGITTPPARQLDHVTDVSKVAFDTQGVNSIHKLLSNLLKRKRNGHGRPLSTAETEVENDLLLSLLALRLQIDRDLTLNLYHRFSRIALKSDSNLVSPLSTAQNRSSRKQFSLNPIPKSSTVGPLHQNHSTDQSPEGYSSLSPGEAFQQSSPSEPLPRSSSSEPFLQRSSSEPLPQSSSSEPFVQSSPGPLPQRSSSEPLPQSSLEPLPRSSSEPFLQVSYSGSALQQNSSLEPRLQTSSQPHPQNSSAEPDRENSSVESFPLNFPNEPFPQSSPADPLPKASSTESVLQNSSSEPLQEGPATEPVPQNSSDPHLRNFGIDSHPKSFSHAPSPQISSLYLPSTGDPVSGKPTRGPPSQSTSVHPPPRTSYLPRLSQNSFPDASPRRSFSSDPRPLNSSLDPLRPPSSPSDTLPQNSSQAPHLSSSPSEGYSSSTPLIVAPCPQPADNISGLVVAICLLLIAILTLLLASSLCYNCHYARRDSRRFEEQGRGREDAHQTAPLLPERDVASDSSSSTR